MEEIQTSEDLTMNQQEVEDAITEVIEEVLMNVVYDDSQVGGWIDSICEMLIKRLYDMNKPYKYCVSCFIM
jgi:dynein light chain Tctex-type 1